MPYRTRLRRVLALSTLAIATPVAAADAFRCADLAKFGYWDWLCQSPTEIVTVKPIEPIQPQRPDTTQDGPGPAVDSRARQDGELDFTRQNEWVARRTWASPRPMDSISPPYAYPGFSFYENFNYDFRLPFRFLPPRARPADIRGFGPSP